MNVLQSLESKNELPFELQKQARVIEKPVFLPHLSVRLSSHHTGNRGVVEKYVARQFYANHQAEITSFLPFLLSAETTKNITSAIGFRLAGAENTLFLEQYFEAQAQVIIGDLLNKTIDRNKVAEIGNLTSSHPASSQMLFVLIISVLHKLDVEWALFTATEQVQVMVEELNIDCLNVCEARSESLGDAAASWGTYYNNRPNVLAGNIENAYNTLKRHPVAGFMMKNYEVTINELVDQVKFYYQ